MGFLNSIMSAVEDPNTMGSMGQVAGILGAVNGVANQNGVDKNTMQSVVGVVGKYVQGGLQEKRAQGGSQQVQDLVSQFAGTQPSEQALNAILSAPQINGLVGELEKMTGLDAGTERGLLPTAVPLVYGQMPHASTQTTLTHNAKGYSRAHQGKAASRYCEAVRLRGRSVRHGRHQEVPRRERCYRVDGGWHGNRLQDRLRGL